MSGKLRFCKKNKDRVSFLAQDFANFSDHTRSQTKTGIQPSSKFFEGLEFGSSAY